MAVSAPVTQQEFTREIERIASALAENGGLDRRELARPRRRALLGARDGSRAALREAVLSGKAGGWAATASGRAPDPQPEMGRVRRLDRAQGLELDVRVEVAEHARAAAQKHRHDVQ